LAPGLKEPGRTGVAGCDATQLVTGETLVTALNPVRCREASSAGTVPRTPRPLSALSNAPNRSSQSFRRAATALGADAPRVAKLAVPETNASITPDARRMPPGWALGDRGVSSLAGGPIGRR